jgi:hypothetical protein
MAEQADPLLQEVLQEAIDSLQIRDVYLRDSESYLAEGFEPKYDPDVDALEVQFQHVVTESSVLEIEENAELPARLFRVFIRLGARLVAPPAESSVASSVAPTESDDAARAAPSTDQAGDQDRESVDPGSVRALVTGMMVAEYDMVGKPSETALKAFALRNASYHVWPYWREFLASQCVRMNLPKVVLPAVQFARRPEPVDSPQS